MAGNISNGSHENDSGEETSPKTGLSTSFTISFEDDDDRSALKQKKIKTTNMFVRRHVRTLSLPLNNDCLVNKVSRRVCVFNLLPSYLLLNSSFTSVFLTE